MPAMADHGLRALDLEPLLGGPEGRANDRAARTAGRVVHSRAPMKASPEATPASQADAHLLQRLRAGDDDAYEELVRTTSSRLLAVARRIVGSDQDAQDVLQEAYASAFRSIGRFEGQAMLSTWLHRIVVNRALMRLRTRKRKPEESIEPLLPSFKGDGHMALTAGAWGEPADSAMEHEEVRAFVRAQIDRLPDAYRTVLLLRDIEEMSTSDVATLLETTDNAVKIRLHRARQALRALLDQRFGARENGTPGAAR